MNVRAGDLLKLLGSGVRPDGPTHARAAAAPGVDFQELLRGAQAGELTSGRLVAAGSDFHGSLTSSQIARLSSAADAAEASGATRLLAVVDNRSLIVDIASREVVAELTPGEAQPGTILTDIDAAVSLASDSFALTGASLTGADAASDGSALPATLPFPTFTNGNELLQQLAQPANSALQRLLAKL